MLQDPDPDLRQMAADEVSRLAPVLERIEDRAEGPAVAQGSARRKERRARNPRRHRRRRSHAVRGRNLPHVHALRRIAALARGSHVAQRIPGGRPQGSDRAGQRRQGLQPAEVRKRRASRAARPATEQQGRVHTSAITVAVLPEADEVEIKLEAKDIRIDTFCSSGPGRPIGEHHLFRGAHHASADGTDRLLPGREIADQESRQGRARAALAALRD